MLEHPDMATILMSHAMSDLEQDGEWLVGIRNFLDRQ